MLFGAIGRNLALGLIDAIMYPRGLLLPRRAQPADASCHPEGPGCAARTPALASALPEGIAAVLETAELERIRTEGDEPTGTPKNPSLDRTDWLGRWAFFSWSCFHWFPVVLPFLFFRTQGAHRGLQFDRDWNAVPERIFWEMFRNCGRCGRERRWYLVGVALVAITMVLGVDENFRLIACLLRDARSCRGSWRSPRPHDETGLAAGSEPDSAARSCPPVSAMGYLVPGCRATDNPPLRADRDHTSRRVTTK